MIHAGDVGRGLGELELLRRGGDLLEPHLGIGPAGRGLAAVRK